MKVPFCLCFFVWTFCISAQPSVWYNSGIGGGGSLFAPSISPSNPDHIYIQCDMSEVFHTTNAGQQWSPVPFTQLISTGGIHTVEFTSDPNILYTVNYGFLDDTRFPVKSTDGGATWQALSNDPTGGEVWYISADPNSTQRLILASYTALYLSSDGGNTFSLKYNNNSDFLISGVFWDGNNIFVGTQIGLLVSSDGGNQFSLDNGSGFPSGYGFMSFTGSKSNGITRLMGTIANQADLYPGVNALDIDIYSSIIARDYGAGGWTTKVGGISSDDNLFYIASADNNSAVFYVGGTNPNTAYPVIYKTSDGGNTWSPVFLTTNNQNIYTGYSGYQGDEDWWYGEIVFGLAVAPTDAQRVIFTDFGFAHISQDGGATWRQAYVDAADQNPPGSPTPKDKAYHTNGLENTSCWNLHWLKNNPSIMMASYTDITALRSTDGGNKWAFDFDGISYNTVYHVIEHPTNGTLYAAVSSVHDMYQSTYLMDSRIDGGTGAILYSTDQGEHWNMLHNFNHPVIWLALDPNNPNRMYASVIHSVDGGIYTSANVNLLSSSSWTKTSSPPRTEGHPYNVAVLNDGMLVTTWSGRRASGNFTASSGVFISNDQGSTWQDRSDRPNMDYWTKDITIDPNDPTQNTWYVAVFSGWGGPSNDKGGLYKSTDRGLSWTKIFNGYRVESCTIDPANPSKAYVTTENEGLWYSSNINTSNPEFIQQTSYDFMHPMRVIYNPHDLTKIWITSFGNGLKYGEDPSIPLQLFNLDLNGYASIDGNLLSWKFDPSEEIMDTLYLQKSKDGKSYENIYLEQNTTHFSGQKKDTQPYPITYYRLKIRYASGRSEYSQILALKNDHFHQIFVFPTLVSDHIVISHVNQGLGDINVKIVNIQGNRVIDEIMSMGDEKIINGLEILLPGFYTIILYQNGVLLYSGRFIKQ